MVMDLAPHHHVKFQKKRQDFGNVFNRDEPIWPILLLHGWAPERHVVHAVYPSKCGRLPSVRALLDHLSACFSELRED
jgi:DNA-binding transcriptional LysR family regulator